MYKVTAEVGLIKREFTLCEKGDLNELDGLEEVVELVTAPEWATTWKGAHGEPSNTI